MIEHYRARYPNFDHDYAQEIQELMDVLALWEARDTWLKGDKWPLVRHFYSKPGLKSRLLALMILVWPAKRAAQALRLRGEVLPDEIIDGELAGLSAS